MFHLAFRIFLRYTEIRNWYIVPSMADIRLHTPYHFYIIVFDSRPKQLKFLQTAFDKKFHVIKSFLINSFLFGLLPGATFKNFKNLKFSRTSFDITSRIKVNLPLGKFGFISQLIKINVRIHNELFFIVLIIHFIFYSVYLIPLYYCWSFFLFLIG